MPDSFVVRPRGSAASAADGPPVEAGAPPATRARRAPEARPHPALGPFGAVARDPQVTDLFVNGATGLFADRGAGPERVPEWHASEDEVRALAVSLIGAGGRHLDDATPAVDVRLPGGVRIHAVLPPIATGGTTVSVRIPRLVRPTLAQLAESGMLGHAQLDWLREVVRARQNVLLSGAGGAGKTTLLAGLLAEAGPQERIVTIEDVAELRIDHPHHVALESRQPNLEGAGGVTLERLVREALRMRPDRLVVGECRGAEVRELLAALNTGHDGGAGTLHASGIADVPARLEALGALAGLGDRALARQVVSAIAWVLHVERDVEGVRRLAAVGSLTLAGSGRLDVAEVTPWG